jgi:hypothetical protein
MANHGWPHGEAIIDKKWQYFSPSTLMAADFSTSEGCLRRVYYEKILRLKGPEQGWQTLGRELHAQNEIYLLTGDKSGMGSLALSGLHMLPKPFTVDPRIMIEHEIGGKPLADAPCKAAGIPVAGYIDAIHWQGTNAGASDVTDTVDPEGTVEVVDWKTTSDPKWIKSAQEVSRTLQMTIYGKWALITKQAEQVRLSHGYYITKGRHTPRKVSLRVHRDQIEERWEYVEHLASSLVEAIKEDKVDNVPANTKACGAYKGCPHQSYCTAYSHNSLASIFGTDFAASLLGQDKPSESILTVPPGTDINMSLLAKLQAANTTTPPPAGPKPEVAIEMKRLALEEVAIKYPTIANTIEALEKVGLGLPTLLGEAARVYAIIKGAAPFAVGELAQFTFDDPNQLPVVLAEAQAIVASRKVAPGITAPTPVEAPVAVVSPFPEDAPPALASPPEAEEPAPVITNAAEAIEAAAGETKKKGRKKKAEETATVDATAPTPAASTVTHYVAELSPEATAINLYVDCIPSCKFESFWPFVNQVTSKMAEIYGAEVALFGGKDYRVVDDKSPLAYGKGKGFLAAGLRAMAIPPGNYVLDNSMTETGAVVVEAMREVVAASGGLLVRGIR